MDIARRVKQAEQTLSLNQQPIVCEIVYFGSGPLPPEERHGNVIVRHVSYETVRERLEKAGKPGASSREWSGRNGRSG